MKGLRFQRRLPLGRFLRLNLSKSGIGLSAGRPGARFGVDAHGRPYGSVGWPGSGLSYRIGGAIMAAIAALVAALVLILGG